MHTEDSYRHQTTDPHLPPAKCNIHQDILFVTWWPDPVPVLMVSQAQHHAISKIFDDIDISSLSHGTGISLSGLRVSGNNAGRMRDAGRAQGRSPPWLQSVSWNEMDDGNAINGYKWHMLRMPHINKYQHFGSWQRAAVWHVEVNYSLHCGSPFFWRHLTTGVNVEPLGSGWWKPCSHCLSHRLADHGKVNVQRLFEWGPRCTCVFCLSSLRICMQV